MMRKKWIEYRKCLSAIPLAMIMNIHCFHKADADVIGSINDFFLQSMFDVRRYTTQDRMVLLLSFESVCFILLFAVFCGMDIYAEMHIRGTYTVIRIKNRKLWIFRQVGCLAQKILGFSILYAGTVWLLQCYYLDRLWDTGSEKAFFVAVCFLWETIFLLALFINEISLHSTVRTGSVSGVLMLTALVFAAIFYENIPLLSRWPYINPLWICNLYYVADQVWVSKWIVYHIVICTVCVVGFVWHNQNLEISLSKKEE